MPAALPGHPPPLPPGGATAPLPHLHSSQLLRPSQGTLQTAPPTAAPLPSRRIRDLNDEINKLIREKGHWEKRIVEMGGPDYSKVGPKVTDSEGRAVGEAQGRGPGYRYFGAAKQLPGVKELFEKEAPRQVGGGCLQKGRGLVCVHSIESGRGWSARRTSCVLSFSRSGCSSSCFGYCFMAACSCSQAATACQARPPSLHDFLPLPCSISSPPACLFACLPALPVGAAHAWRDAPRD